MKIIFYLLVSFFILSAYRPCQCMTYEFGGYYRNYFFLNTHMGERPSRGVNVNSSYLKFRLIKNDVLTLNMSISLYASASDPSFLPEISKVDSSFQYCLHKKILYPDNIENRDPFCISADLERLNIIVKTPKFDVLAGRQALSWGMSRFISPTDIFIKTSFFDAVKNESRGIDALLFRTALTDKGDFTAGFVLGKNLDSKNSAYFVKARTSFLGLDAELLFCEFKQEPVIGVSFSHPVGGALIWSESAFYGDFQSLNSSLGCDFFLQNGAYMFFEIFFNQMGEGSTKDYWRNESKEAYIKKLVYLGGRNYFTFGIDKQITPLVSHSLRISVNASEPSIFTSLVFDINLRENAYLDLGYTGGEVLSGMDNESGFSEYGSMGKSFFGSVSIYF